MHLLAAVVSAVEEPTPGVQRLTCVYRGSSGVDGCGTGSDAMHDVEQTYTALNYLALGAACAVGDTVLLNVTALDLGLGTGGLAFVVPSTEFVEKPSSGRRGAFGGSSRGHIMKLRYTPLQREVLAVEEEASPYHETMCEAHTLAGMPVVCCGLFSQVPLAAAAIKQRMPEARVIFCMTDEAALMLDFAQLATAARAVGLLDGIITCGQALGGDLEAVTLHSGLLAARYALAADVVIVGIGPGIVGTATPFGHGGIAQAEALNAAAALGGTPIAVLRLSFADARPRHQGVSHHTLTALGVGVLAPVQVACPSDLPPEQLCAVERALETAGITRKHQVVSVAVGAATLAGGKGGGACGDSAGINLRGLDVTTMGRSQLDDPAFFSAAFAAGFLAVDGA